MSNPWLPPSARPQEGPREDGLREAREQGAEEAQEPEVERAHEPEVERAQEPEVERAQEPEVERAQEPEGEGAQEEIATKHGWHPSRRTIIEWVVIIALAVGAVLAVRAWVIEPFWIPSASMSPTLKDNDKVLVNKLAYDFHSVHRGDIVVFSRPHGAAAVGITDKVLIKRVIGLPGETISARGGYVYIDGAKLNEHWLPKQDVGVTQSFGPVTIPAGYYFVMGDNRTDSEDSRVFGPIPRNVIIGRAFVRIWPLSRLGFL